MNWNNWLRQIHRWLSVAFTVAVVLNMIAMVQEKSTVWVGFLALLPLGLLLLTGLYLFLLPYAARWRGR
ncbi:hypothetical protein Rleg4DRAFT_1216 [Rhizobium leguminosarum bv. trifolii WSM2297]|uniref:Uncharacterized protein n=1 Tax=Rhizobium leguminosarum bv. trifolii WSM2297 TaxID=754762 RepID=J0CJG5_RHILT|nr:hypothetical protein [Rhizobium leguminosarum]EJC79620.1 hypothetical protein Rleg4DRAFT_1216 [Rhizobium leguminosarum bv. trifolii WSM2297]